MLTGLVDKVVVKGFQSRAELLSSPFVTNTEYEHYIVNTLYELYECIN